MPVTILTTTSRVTIVSLCGLGTKDQFTEVPALVRSIRST